jgi:ComF family protein
LAAVDYAFPWQTLLSQFKFHKQTGWASFFAKQLLVRAEVARCLAALGPEDLLLPMPLSSERLAERGFNQAWELVQALHQHSRCAARTDARLLLRVRDTPAQSQLGRQERLRNLQGAFMVDPLRSAHLSGRTVVLVDDVMTTGASLCAASQALLAAGAASVTGVVVARTPP